jgi:hypothetical protein
MAVKMYLCDFFFFERASVTVLVVNFR